MIEKIKKLYNFFLTKGFLRNTTFSFIKTKVFWRNRYILLLVLFIILINIISWFLWSKIIVSGFAMGRQIDHILNIPLIPRTHSLLFINYFISIVNLLISFIVYTKGKFFSYVLLISTVFLNFSIIALALYYIYDLGLW